jgi:chromosomal replication initiator protein
MTQKFPFDQFLKWDEDNSIKIPPSNLFSEEKSHSHHAEKMGKIEKTSLLSHQESEILSQEIKHYLQQRISPQQFSTYFQDTFHVSQFDGQVIEFTVPTAFIKRIIESQFLNEIKEAIKENLGRDYHINIQLVGQNSQQNQNFFSQNPQVEHEMKIRKSSSVKNNTFVIPDLIPTEQDKMAAATSQAMDYSQNYQVHNGIDQQKRFENFIVGPSNNLAHATALAVSRDPGKVYPNLYVYGQSGLGKTHLIHAIANYITENHPRLRILITSCTNMMNEYVESTMTNRRPEFYKKYTKDVDVLIIDDIHDLSGKQATQDQFFHIFNDLSSRKKQLIFTSDKTPKEILGIEERIKTRLSSALSIEIQQPDLETRMAILKMKAQEKDFYLSDEVLNLIAKCVKTSVRELEGNLIQLQAYYDLTHVDIDLAMARDLLKLNEEMDSQKHLSMDSITKTVAQYYKIPLGDIRGKAKTKDIVLARQVAMYMIHQHLRKTLIEIALYFGKKDHTTPMYSLEIIRKRQKADPAFAQQLLDIEKIL